jgi:tetratricopeptide (TPR) repeat protein
VREDAAEAAALARRALLADGRSCAACLALAAALCRAPDGGGAGGAKLRADALAAYAEAEARASPGAQLADVHHQRGRALFGAGDLRGARSAFEKSICEDDYGARAHADLAVCLYELGDEAGALEAFERALALDPSDASVRAQAEEVAAYLGATLRGGATNGPRRRGGGGGGGGGEGGGFGAAPPAGGRAARGGSGFGGKGRAK